MERHTDCEDLISHIVDELKSGRKVIIDPEQNGIISSLTKAELIIHIWRNEYDRSWKD